MAGPASRSLTGWWQGSFAPTAWGGSASAGSSAAHTLDELAIGPTSGAAQNGKTPADFNAAQQIEDAVTAANVYISPSAWTVAFVFKSRTAVADAGAGNEFANPGIFSDTGQWFGAGFSTSGVVGFSYDGVGSPARSLPCGTGTYNLAAFRLSGGLFKGQLNNTGWTAGVSAGNNGATTSNLQLGTNWNGGVGFDGLILDFLIADSALADADIYDYGFYVQSRYALSLGFSPRWAVVPDQIGGRSGERRRAHPSRMQSFVGRVDPPVAAVSLLQPNRRAQPDAIDRRQILARMPSVTTLSPLPIPTDTTAFAQMRAAMPDVLSRRFHRAALNDAAELPPFQPPALTPIALTEWPDRIASPSRQAFRDAGPTFPTQQTFTPLAMTTWPDIISKPTRVRDAGAVLPPTQIANAVTPVALTTYPSAAPRPRFGAHLQLQVTSVPPQPERTSPLVEADFPATVRRPQLAAAQHRFFAMAPKPEQKIALGFQGRFPQYTRRPIFPASQQKSVAYWPFPLPDAPIVPDIVARDAVAVWMLPSHAIAVSKGAHDAVEVWKLPRRTGIVVRFARDTAEVETLPGSTTRVRGTS